MTVETKRLELNFEIGPKYVKLIERDEPELRHIVDKEMAPGYLLKKMSRAGIHLMPDDEDAKLAGIPLKDHRAEQHAIIDIMTGIRSFAFSNCKWNTSASPENIVIKFKENLEYD